MRLRKQHGALVDPRIELEKQARLTEAENRANTLLRTAEWLHAVISQRDSENQWQESVNRLFTGRL